GLPQSRRTLAFRRVGRRQTQTWRQEWECDSAVRRRSSRTGSEVAGSAATEDRTERDRRRKAVAQGARSPPAPEFNSKMVWPPLLAHTERSRQSTERASRRIAQTIPQFHAATRRRRARTACDRRCRASCRASHEQPVVQRHYGIDVASDVVP